MKWIYIGGAVGALYLWWSGGANTSDPLASLKAGWNKATNGTVAPSTGRAGAQGPCAGCADVAPVTSSPITLGGM